MRKSNPPRFQSTRGWTRIHEYRDGKKVYGLSRSRRALWVALTEFVARQFVIKAGRRALKTIIIARFFIWLLKRSEPGQRYFIMAPTRQQVKDIYWDKLKELCPPEVAYEIRETELAIITPWGSVIRLYGAEAAKRVEGSPWDGGAVDECADVDGGIFDAHLIPALADRKGFLIRLGVPDFNGPGQEEFQKCWNRSLKGSRLSAAMKRRKPGDKRFPMVGFEWVSAEVLDPEEIEAMVADMAPAIARQELTASFERPASAAYVEFSSNAYPHGNVWDDYEFKPRASVLIACDFNYTFMRWSICQADPSVKPFAMRVVASVSIDNANVERTCEQLVIALRELDPSVDWKYARNLWFFGDFSGHQHRAEATATAWETVQEFFPNAEINAEPNPFVADRLNTTNGFLCNARGERRLTVHSQCVELIEDFEKVTREMVLFKKQTAGRLTHASDGIGYLLTSYYHI